MGHRIDLDSGVDRWLGRASNAIAGVIWNNSTSLFSVIRLFFDWLFYGHETNASYRNKIQFGTEYETEAAASSNVVLVKITETIVAEIYRDEGNTNKGTIRVGKLEGDVWTTWGAAMVFADADTEEIGATLLDGDAAEPTIAIGYIDAGNVDKGTLCIVSVNMDTLVVTGGTESVFNDAITTGNVIGVGVCVNQIGYVTVAYRDEGGVDYAALRSVAVAGLVIDTWGTEVELNASAATNVGIVSMDKSTGAVIAMFDDVGGLTTRAVLIVGAVIGTPGTEKVVTTDTDIVSPVIKKIKSTTFFLAYQDGDLTNDPMNMLIGFLDATTITLGAIRTVTNAVTTEIDADVDESEEHHIAVTYVYGARAYVLIVCVLNDILYWADPYMWNDAASLTTSVVFLNHFSLALGCEDDGGSDYAIIRSAVILDSRRKMQTRAKMLQGSTASGTAVTLLEVWGSGILRSANFAGSGANNYTVVATVDELEKSIVVSATQATAAHLAYDNENPGAADAFILSKETNFISAEELDLPFRDHLKITGLTSAGTLNYKIYYNEDGD